jgi:hypothetical protein
MSSGAAHLVDHVLPEVAVRQWVLSVPWPRRYLFARRPDLCAGVRRLVWRSLNRWYGKRAAQLGHPGGQSGAVIVIQRFGSSLALNVHFHMLLLGPPTAAGPCPSLPSASEVWRVFAVDGHACVCGHRLEGRGA